jgi:hypothetical protein
VGIAQIDVSTANTCALLVDGSVECLGTNYYGQLGIGTADADAHSVPAQVLGLP